MKVHLESTTKLVTVDRVPARVWEGVTESGIPVVCLITRVAVDVDHDQAQFEAELNDCRSPSTEVDAWPARMIL